MGICATIYGIAVIPVFVLMLVMSIPVLTIYGISEDNINQICAVAANDSDLVAEPVKADVKADAGRLLQAAETTSLRQDAEIGMPLQTYHSCRPLDLLYRILNAGCCRQNYVHHLESRKPEY